MLKIHKLRKVVQSQEQQLDIRSVELGLIFRMKMCGMCDGNYVVELPKFVARSLEQRNKHEIRFLKIHMLMINEFDLPGTKGRGLDTYIPKHR